MLKKFKIPKQILYPLILALFLNLLRVILFDNKYYLFMYWNIFLAAIPFLISSFLLFYINKDRILKPVFIIGFFLWFIFLPNASYMITDFIHLGRIRSAPVIFDTFLIFTFAWTAILLGLYSLAHIEKILLLKFSKKLTNIIILITIFFTSFGIYLGRYLRLNSWDLFVSHTTVINSVWKVVNLPGGLLNLCGYVTLFFIFIYIIYKSTKLEV